MKTQAQEKDGKTVITVTGDVGNSQVEEFSRFLMTAFDEGSHHLIIEASDIVSLNSAAIGVLAALQRRILKEGGSLVIRHPRPAIDRLLRVTRLDTVITVERLRD